MAVVGVLVLGWLVVLERDRRLEARASETSARIIQPGNFERSESDFEAARLLNPDVNPDLKRAYLYLGAGRVEQAAGVIEDVVRREPDNVAAWAALYTISRERDPAAARRALEARRRLDPLNAP